MDTISPLIVVAVMGVAGLLDTLYREVEPLYWFYATLLGGLVYLDEYSWLLHGVDPVILGLALVPATLMIVLYLVGAMGGADVMAMVFLSVAYPMAPDALLPIPVLAVLYASLPSLTHRVWMASRVCRRPRCLLTGRLKVEAWRLTRDPRLRWWLVSDKRLGGLDVGLETWEAAARLGMGELVEVTPGLPYVAHLALGTVLAVVLGDEPIIKLIGLIMGI